ncbi:hypothetical protein BGZ63DRAFT_389166 [Mariannaea sp. PMI_226]|nr:hypothetical protein BGZ63DRAFT_389166 [Mariannaea sp. PMI_226]
MANQVCLSFFFFFLFPFCFCSSLPVRYCTCLPTHAHENYFYARLCCNVYELRINIPGAGTRLPSLPNYCTCNKKQPKLLYLLS